MKFNDSLTGSFHLKKEIYFYKYLRYYSKQHFSLICRNTISINITTSDTVISSRHFIPTIAFNGIYSSITDALYNSNMVNRSIISLISHRIISILTPLRFFLPCILYFPKFLSDRWFLWFFRGK